MNEPANHNLLFASTESCPQARTRIVVVSSDRDYSESLRSHLAGEYDVLLARNGGEAAAKAQAVSVDVAVVDLGSAILGMSALCRMRSLPSAPVICALALPEAPPAQSQFDFDYVLARPSNGAELPERIRFILAKAKSVSGQRDD